jgi:hypothetical protein
VRSPPRASQAVMTRATTSPTSRKISFVSTAGDEEDRHQRVISVVYARNVGYQRYASAS